MADCLCHFIQRSQQAVEVMMNNLTKAGLIQTLCFYADVLEKKDPDRLRELVIIARGNEYKATPNHFCESMNRHAVRAIIDVLTEDELVRMLCLFIHRSAKDDPRISEALISLFADVEWKSGELDNYNAFRECVTISPEIRELLDKQALIRGRSEDVNR